MEIKKYAATALLAVAATGIGTSTAYAQSPAATAAISGVDHGVAYTTSWTADHSSMTTTLRSGRFVLTPEANSVAVVAANGTVLAQLPIAFQQAGKQIRLTPQVSRAGSTLTLGSRTAVDQQLTDIDAGSTLAGVAIGCVVGGLIGLFFLILPAIPGCIIGAVVGGIIGANQ